MSFPKCSNLEAKKLYTSYFVIKKANDRIMISNKQNLESEAFYGFYTSENQNLKKIKTENKAHKNLKINSAR